MSDQTDNTERRIIEAQSSSLLIRDEREKSPIISEIVTSALTIAQGSEILLNDAESIFQKAKKLYNSSGSKQSASRREAFALFQEASLKDHAEARYFIGCFYNYGIIVDQNPTEGVWHYMGAAELNHPLALDVLGTCTFAGYGTIKDYKEAATYYLRAAQLGDYIAQSNIGSMYDSGYGVNMDWDMAKYWYEKSANQGHWESAYKLGNHYLSKSDDSLSDENKIAFKWLLQAANQGHNYSIQKVSNAYFLAIGTEKDKREAYKWACRSQDLLSSDKFPIFTQEMSDFLDVIKNSMSQEELIEADKYYSDFIENLTDKNFICEIDNDDQPQHRFRNRISS